MENYKILEKGMLKALHSENANYLFNKRTGRMTTWGKTKDDDAEKFPVPTIADIEITTSCDGMKSLGCNACYKSNNPNGENMTLDTFQKLFAKLPNSLTQIAFGADAKGTANPDLLDIMKYTRKNEVIPNITLAQISDSLADELVKVVGAVAVSVYDDKDIAYDSIKKLTDRGLTQVNIHFMIAEETYSRALEIIEDIQTDTRLEKLNALVFLSLKQKGRGVKLTPLKQENFTNLVQTALSKSLRIGFDSCSSLKFFNSLNEEQHQLFQNMIMPCESTLESSYINVKGEFYPCSFAENTVGWEDGISVLDSADFQKDVWNNSKTEKFRKALLETKKSNKFGCRDCPMYKI